MNLWTYNVREIQRRPGRMLLTLLGLTVGLATVVATRLSIHTVDGAYRELFAGISGRPSLEVTAKGQGGFDPGLIGQLESIRGVKAVVPRIQSAAALVSPTGSVAVPMLGIEPDSVAFEDWSLREGRYIRGDEDALIDPGLADSLRLKAGQVIELWTPSGPARLRLAGILKPHGASAATGGQMIVSLVCAQRLFALADRVNGVQVLLADDADPHTVQSQIAQRLPTGLVVQPPGMRGEMGRATLLAAQQGLSSLSIVALIAAAFVILNTFLLNLGERRKQVAVLRSLGASRWQVMWLLLRETFLLGLGGTVAGCVCGMGLAVGLNFAMGQFLGLPLPRMQWSVEPFLLAFLLGPVTSAVAGCLPAWRASRRPPLAELMPGHAQGEELLPRSVWRLGLLLLLAGLGLQLTLWRGAFSESAARLLLTPTLACLLIGCVLVLPLVIDPLLTLACHLPLGLEGNLAARQLARHRGRTYLTCGVLFLALVVAIAFGQSLQTTLRDLRHWYRQTIVADFLVRGAMPDSSFLLAPALPETLGAEISRFKASAVVDSISFVPAEIEEQPVLVLARTFAVDRPLPLDLQEGDEAQVRSGLLAGEAVLGTGLAQRLGLHRGESFHLTTAQGVREIRVAGTAVEYASGGLALYLEWKTAQNLLEVPGVHVFLVSAAAGGTDELAADLREFCERHHLLFQSNADLRDLIEAMLSRVMGVLWGLIALAFAVASLGIINTLAMNVHDQTREFGMLRALGLKRAQVGKIVLAQAAILVCFSLLPGTLTGVGLAYTIHRSSSAWAGPQTVFRIDGLLVLSACALAVLIAVLAGIAPARRAARLPVAQALHQA